MDDNSILTKFSFEEEEDTLNNVLGRESEKNELLAAIPSADLDEVLVLSNFSAFLLCGRHGCGKSFLLHCYAGTLMQNGFCLYEIDCADILKMEDPCRVWRDIFEEILIRTNPEGEFCERIHLKLIHLTAISDDSDNIQLIAGYLDRLVDDDCTCIITAESYFSEDIPAEFLDRMTIMDLELPDYKDRMAYFEYNFVIAAENPEDENEIFSVTPLNFSMDTFAAFCAENTESLNYFDMKRVIDQSKRLWKAKLGEIAFQKDEIYAQLINPKGIRVNEEDFLNIVKRVKKISQNREKTESAVRNRYSVQTTTSVQAAPTIIQVPAVQAAPQIVYAQAPSPFMNSRFVSSASEPIPDPMKSILDRIDENPLASDLIQAYNMLPRNRNTGEQQNEEQEEEHST